MKIYFKKLFLVFLMFLILISAYSINLVAKDDEWLPAPDTIDIGASMELTGPTALTGQMETFGIELGLEKINQQGGVDGIPLRLIFEDNKGTNPGMLAAVNKLIYDHNVLALSIGVRSTANHATSPLLIEAEIPAIYGGSAWSVRELKNPWMFGVRTNDRSVSGIMAKFIVEDLGHEKIAGLYSDEAFGQGGNQETNRALKEFYDIEPIIVERFARGTQDFTAQMLAIKQSGAKCLYSWSVNSEDDGIILRQVKQLGLDLDFIGGASYGNLEVVLPIAGEDAEGIYVVVDYSPENKAPTAKRLNDEMVAKHGIPASSNTQWMYDGILVLADAIKRAGIIKEIDGKKMIMPLEQAREAIRDALKKTKGFSGDATKTYTCDDNNDLSHAMVVVQIKDGTHLVNKIVDLME